ncbi:MAG: shikimate kinase [Cellulosilyticaceae bacterium]
MKNNIYLIGFMGCGKTTIGQQIAIQQGKKFYDLDRQVVKSEGKSIKYLFETYGETYFRKVETNILLETKHYKQVIIATGGGVVECEENREFLKNQFVIYLDLPFELVYQRVKNDDSRPLAISKDKLYERYVKRQNLYEEVSAYKILCEGHTPYRLSKLILDQIK